jgi:hypothetical protein
MPIILPHKSVSGLKQNLYAKTLHFQQLGNALRLGAIALPPRAQDHGTFQCLRIDFNLPV